MKILVVDDSDFFRSSIKRMLGHIKNLEFADAANGIEALEQHRSFKPELIFMDITMPHLDGLTTLKIIKAIDYKVKVIMLSALAGQNFYAQECKTAGADLILNKPVNNCMLVDALMATCSRGLMP